MTSPISDNPLADDGQLLAWGYDLGADLEELDQLLSSGAVGLAVNSWRNTELENIHASTGVYEVVDALIPDDADDRDTLVSEEAGRRIAAYADTTCQPGSYGRVGDPAEQERLDAIVAGRREEHGIPDDLIMRANAFTAADIRSLLTGVVGTGLLGVEASRLRSGAFSGWGLSPATCWTHHVFCWSAALKSESATC